MLRDLPEEVLIQRREPDEHSVREPVFVYLIHIVMIYTRFDGSRRRLLTFARG